MSILLSQQATSEELVTTAGLSDISSTTKPTPYRSGHPVDKIPLLNTLLPLHIQSKLEETYRSLVGSLNWLSTATRPDIATITNILSAYLHKSTPSHLAAVKHVIKYIKGTTDLGICFSTFKKENLEAFIKFPIDQSKILPFTDANWGPQDASVPKPNSPEVLLDLFKSRSISGFLIWLGGPLHWCSKRQTITARSSAEAEIYATDECCKSLQHILNLIEDLNLTKTLVSLPIKVYNDNEAAVKWSRKLTTKGLRHLQMRENSVRELENDKVIQVLHIGGTDNISDMFTKEDKDIQHYLECRDSIMTSEQKFFTTNS